MRYISHRGNISHVNLELENDPKYITKALELGYYVEIDIWIEDNSLFLGHDYPKYEINESFLNNKYLYVHCKNHEALLFMNSNDFDCDYFWHEDDNFTFTSKGIIWSHFKSNVLKNSIKVCLNFEEIDLSSCYGICSDDIESFKNKYENNISFN
jgi:hypothetical protein